MLGLGLGIEDEGLTSPFLANLGFPPQKRSELNANGSGEKVILNVAGVQLLHGPTVASNTICCLDNLSPRAFPGSVCDRYSPVSGGHRIRCSQPSWNSEWTLVTYGITKYPAHFERLERARAEQM